MTIKLQTVTPLWTGGVNGQADRIHTSGIIGSLRWWYEALIRGLGGVACDPSEHQCLYDAESNIRAVCDACQIFGATGWKRRFRLLVEDSSTAGGPTGTHQPTGARYTKGGPPKRPTWYFNGGRIGTVVLSIISLDSDFDPLLILGLLKLIEKNAAMAAKPQLGYGIVKLIDAPTLDVDAFLKEITHRLQQPWSNNQNEPSLAEMFFAEVTPDSRNQATAVQTMLNLKYDLRAAFRTAPTGLIPPDLTMLRHFICGKEQPDEERQASKIAISQPIGGRLRIWGWIPSSLPVRGTSQSSVVDIIYGTLSGFGTVNRWRKFQSLHDPIKLLNMKGFLKSLLEEAS